MNSFIKINYFVLTFFLDSKLWHFWGYWVRHQCEDTVHNVSYGKKNGQVGFSTLFFFPSLEKKELDIEVGLDEGK